MEDAQSPDPDDIAYLAGLSDADFAALVFANVAPTAPEKIWLALCDTELVWRSSHVLREKAIELRDALTDGTAGPDDAALRKLLDWRLRQVRQARKAYAELVRQPREGHNRAVIRALAVGINNHRAACVAEKLEPEPHDNDLWALLEDLRIAEEPGNPGVSLLDMVRGPWAQVAA